jgi:phage baseplate assembly protein gpV
MIVTNSAGQTEIPEDTKNPATNVKSIIGTYGYHFTDIAKATRDHYAFYATDNPDSYDKDNNPVAAHLITMVLPMGGLAETGMYRYPKIGEKVLVSAPDSGTGSYYMLGYIPSSSNEFFNHNTDIYKVTDNNNQVRKDKLFDEEGQVFRYQNTAEAFGNKAPPHSEIGFYKNPKAEWPATANGSDNPSIDTVNIESAGDMRETAANHNFQSAKRMELFVNVPEVDHTKEYAGKNRPFGDTVGDDSELHGGDFHVRAGKRVVIKAGSEIRLQVGRTTLVIDDNGFTVTTRNVTGNFTNTFDTSFQMKPRDGITMTGKNISISALYKLSAGDSLGGALSTTMGNLSLSGRELGISTKNDTEFLLLWTFQALKYVCIGAPNAGRALHDLLTDATDDIDFLDYLNKSISFLDTLQKKVSKFLKASDGYTKAATKIWEAQGASSFFANKNSNLPEFNGTI